MLVPQHNSLWTSNYFAVIFNFSTLFLRWIPSLFNQSLPFYCSAKMIFFPTAAAAVARIVCIVCYYSFVLSYCPSNRIRRSARSVLVHMPFGYVLWCWCSCVYDFFSFREWQLSQHRSMHARLSHRTSAQYFLCLFSVTFEIEKKLKCKQWMKSIDF